MMTSMMRPFGFVLLLAVAGCADILGLPDTQLLPDAGPDAAPAQYRVRGVAAGVIEPVSVRLLATGIDELLTVTADGAFAFETGLPDGQAYTVQFVDAPAACALADAVGAVQGADGDVSLVCALIDDIALASPRVPDLAFATAQLSYRAEVSLVQDAVAVTAIASRPDIDITVAGQPVASGVPSERVALGLGETVIPVLARHAASGAEVGYAITVDRAGAIVQAAFGKASNTGAGDWFGVSVALSARGDILVVGAHGEDSGAMGVDGDPADNSATDSGAVYVFERAGGIWAQEAYLKASNTGAGDAFGIGVALSASGDTLAVGAFGEDSEATDVDGDPADNSATDSGAVYVFERADGTWAQRAYLKASNTGAHDNFGIRIALSASGDTLAVGANGEDSGATGVDGDPANNSAAQSGAVYVFERVGGTWAQQAYLKASVRFQDAEWDGMEGTVARSASFGRVLGAGVLRFGERYTGSMRVGLGVQGTDYTSHFTTGDTTMDGPGGSFEIDVVLSVGANFDARLGEHWVLGVGASVADGFNTDISALETGIHLGYRWSL